MTNRRPWYKHVWVWLLIGVAVLIVAVRLAANPLARHYTQKALDHIPGYRGTFSKVSISFVHLRYSIEDLKLVAEGEEKAAPYVYVKHAEGQLVWRNLLHFHLGAAARLDGAKVTIVVPAPKKKKFQPPNLERVLYSLFPFRIDRVGVHKGQLLVIDHEDTKVPEKSRELWIHDLEAAFENVGSRTSLTKGQPTTLDLKAKIQRSGTLTLFVSADLLRPGLNFAGETALRGLKLDELWGFMVGATNLQPVSGTLDAFATFKCVHGRIDGAVKPELKNAKLQAAQANIGDEIKAKLADTALKLTSDRVPGRNANVAIIPIKGTITNPKAELWPTVLSLVRNAYVEAISGGFAHLPLATAPTKQGPVKQTERALNPKKFPRAQPRQKGHP